MEDLTQRILNAAARFRDRASIRAEIHSKLKQGLPLQADSPERVANRLRRIGIDPAIADMMAGSNLNTLPANLDMPALSVTALERILHTNDLVSVNYLERGAKAARPVGIVRFRRPSDGAEGSGTGFLVSPRLMLTNNHVLPNVETAARGRIEFNYQDDVDDSPLQPIAFTLAPDELFLTNKALDYTLVAVQATSRAGLTLSSFGWHPLIEAEGKVINGEFVTIIQHPNGERKKVALRENELLDVLDHFLHYQTDTAPGSSGSPVFNDQWEVVALHHSGVPKMDDQNRVLNVNGQVWQESEGEDRVDWVANEGVRISRITEDIKSQAVSPAAQALIHDMFSSSANSHSPSDTPSPNGQEDFPLPLEQGQPPEPGLEAQITPLSAPSLPPDGISADGTITWTIPLQVSVKLGQPIAQITSSPTPAIAPTPSLPESTPTAVPSQPDPTLVMPAEKALKAALQDSKSAAKKPYYLEARDRQEREAYYADLLPNVATLSATELYQALSTLVIKTHRRKLAYKPAQYLYPWVDRQPDLKIRSIYSEQAFEAEDLIRADFQVDQIRAVRSQELQQKSLMGFQLAQALAILEASLQYNCEHVVPQSWFAKKEPMRGDLHHLFACETRCNSFRGNTPYFDFEDFGTVIRDSCGKLVGEKFEPNAGKGAVARATLYFLLRYPGEIDQTEREYQRDRLPILLDWHHTDPVGDYERHRNAAIFESQGNRNPLIDFPEWGDRIDFHLGLG
jgi:endonuclease I/V8-like Glu-specific endopeptidase